MKNDQFPYFQSSYRSNHSTETAVLKVLSDILIALDSGKLALMSLLDLSAAFDSVDHDTLWQRLQTSYGLGGNVIAWLASYTGLSDLLRIISYMSRSPTRLSVVKPLDLLLLQFGILSHSTSDIHLLLVPLNVI